MLFSASLLFVLLPSLFTGYYASPLDSSRAAEVMKRDGYNCSNYPSPIPFYRAYQPRIIDHFYTTNPGEYNNAIMRLGYVAEGNAGYLHPEEEQYTTPLYRLYHIHLYDHFYTTNEAERNNAINSLGYLDEGIAGYIFSEQVCGAVPLYRMYNGGPGTDHFYTTSEQEKENAVTHLGYSDEGIAGYVATQ